MADAVTVPSVLLKDRQVASLLQIHGLSLEQSSVLAKEYGLKKPLAERKSTKGQGIQLLSNGPGMWLFEAEKLLPAQSLPALREVLSQTDSTVTDLTSARAIIRVSGASANNLLKKGCPIDIDGMRNKDVASSLIAHFSVTVHAKRDFFDIYVMQSFAEDFWNWCRINAREFNFRER